MRGRRRRSSRYLLRLAELELLDRERRLVERRIRDARFPAVKSLDSFDFTAIPSLNKMLVLELARCGVHSQAGRTSSPSATPARKTHGALALGLAACQRGFSVEFSTAAALVHLLMEAKDERRLLKLQAQLQALKLLIIDELDTYRCRRPAPSCCSTSSVSATSAAASSSPPSAVRRVDQRLRLGAPDRRAARPADPRPHPGVQRRKLPPQAIQGAPAASTPNEIKPSVPSSIPKRARSSNG